MRRHDRWRRCSKSVEGWKFAPKGPTLLTIACLLLFAQLMCVCMIGSSHNGVEKIDNIPFYLLEHKKGMQDKMMLLFALTLWCSAFFILAWIMKVNDLKTLINYFTTKEAEGSRLQFWSLYKKVCVLVELVPWVPYGLQYVQQKGTCFLMKTHCAYQPSPARTGGLFKLLISISH